MANCMDVIAKCLGVELDEVFRIDDYDIEIHGYYKITEQGLYISCSDTPYDWNPAFCQDFKLLITGDIELTKLPQKPAIGDMYCYPDPVTPLLWGTCSWRDDVFDNYRFQHGLIFATREEAIEIAKQMRAVTKQEGKNNG